MDGQALNRPLWVYAAVGLLQGLLLWLAGEYWPSDALARALCSALLMFVLVGGWQLQMIYGSLREQRRWLWLVLCALLIGALSAALAWQFDGWKWHRYRDQGGQWLFLANIGIAFVLTAFIQARNGSARFDYPALCRHAWNNGLALLLASLMLGGFWLLISLWVGLFKMMGVRLFADIFYTAGFGWGASALVCAIALRISLERGTILDALRNVIQAMCRFLLPLTVLILLLFVATLPVLGLEPLWKTRHASAILLSLVFAHLCLVNGVFQDGSQPSGYPRWLQHLVNLSSLLLPLLSGLASYALWLRIAQYGLTPERVFAVLVVLLANLHALALCWAVLGNRRSERWLAPLRASNPWLALVAVVLLVLIQIGPLTPLQLSAANQYQRVLDGVSQDERADLGYLRFELGAPGRAQLQRLRSALPNLEPARQQQLESLLQGLEKAENHWSWRQGPESVAQMRWHGEPPQTATALEEQVRSRGSCRRVACTLWAQDLNQDGSAEVLVIARSSYRFPVFAQDAAGEWRQTGRLSATVTGKELLERLAAAPPISVLPPEIQALQIGDLRLEPDSLR